MPPERAAFFNNEKDGYNNRKIRTDVSKCGY